MAPNLNNLPCVDLKNVDGAMLMHRQDSVQALVENLITEQITMKAKLSGLSDIIQKPAPNVSSRSKRTTRALTVPTSVQSSSYAAAVQSSGGGGNGSRQSVGGNNSNDGLATNSTSNDASSESAPQSDWKRVGKTHKKRPIITGNKTGSTMKAVPQVRMTKIFVSRLDPSITVDIVRDHVKELIRGDCEVIKLKTKFPTYSSFMVTFDQKFDELVMDANHWEDGIMIRRFYGQYRGVVAEHDGS